MESYFSALQGLLLSSREHLHCFVIHFDHLIYVGMQ